MTPQQMVAMIQQATPVAPVAAQQAQATTDPGATNDDSRDAETAVDTKEPLSKRRQPHLKQNAGGITCERDNDIKRRGIMIHSSVMPPGARPDSCSRVPRDGALEGGLDWSRSRSGGMDGKKGSFQGDLCRRGSSRVQPDRRPAGRETRNRDRPSPTARRKPLILLASRSTASRCFPPLTWRWQTTGTSTRPAVTGRAILSGR